MRGPHWIRAFALMTVMCSAAVPLSMGQTTVSVSPETLTVLPGSVVTLTIGVTDVVNLHLYHVVVHFDNTILRCESVVNGGFLPGTFFFHSPSVLPSDTARFLTVDDALTGLQTHSGSGAFFVVQFTALQPGFAAVVLEEVVLRDGSNQNIPHSVIHGAVTVAAPTMSVTMNVQEGWNLVSVPLIVGDYRRASLFHTASSPAFRFQNGYLATDTLRNGTGYWLKFPSAQPLTLSGLPLTRDTIHVSAGWNIIGGLSSAVYTSSVEPLPPVTILSDFYGYVHGGGYTPADTLHSGKGCWVKVNTMGRMIIQSSSRAKK